MAIASVDDYEITAGICRTEGAEEKESFDVHLIMRGRPDVTVFDLDRNRDVAAGFGKRLIHKTIDPDGISELIDDYLGEVYGLP